MVPTTSLGLDLKAYGILKLMMGGFIARFVERGRRRISRIISMPRGSRAFTIIEVLIVLAVTGMLFVSAAVLIAGRRQQTEFNQAIRQVQSQIQQVINDVATGYFPNTNSFQCSAGPSGPVLTSGSGTEQGANAGCIFLGKAMQFGVASTSPQQFNTFTVAGLQKTSGGAEVSSLAQAQPKAISPNTTQATLPDITVTDHLLGGLTIVDMWYNNGAGKRPIGIMAFVNSLSSPGATIVSGTQQLGVVPVDDNNVNSARDRTKLQAASAINTSLATSPLNPTGGVFLCFKSGGTKQSGLITIGNAGRQLSVTLSIKSNLDCS